MSTGPLPGLSKACSWAIRAQLAINGLFTEALQGDEVTAATAATTDTVPTTGTVPTVDATPTADTRPANITAVRVAAVFDELSPSIPSALTKQFATLRGAADAIVGKTIPEIPAVLSSSAATDATHALSDYVAACEPPATN